MATETPIRLKARQAFAAPAWSCEKGDEMEVTDVASARRMIARGLAEAIDKDDKRLQRIGPEDGKVEHSTKYTEILAARLGLPDPDKANPEKR